MGFECWLQLFHPWVALSVLLAIPAEHQTSTVRCLLSCKFNDEDSEVNQKGSLATTRKNVHRLMGIIAGSLCLQKQRKVAAQRMYNVREGERTVKNQG